LERKELYTTQRLLDNDKTARYKRGLPGYEIWPRQDDVDAPILIVDILHNDNPNTYGIYAAMYALRAVPANQVQTRDRLLRDFASACRTHSAFDGRHAFETRALDNSEWEQCWTAVLNGQASTGHRDRRCAKEMTANEWTRIHAALWDAEHQWQKAKLNELLAGRDVKS